MRSAELFTLTVFVVALGIAILAAEVFHVSVALGAFFAGRREVLEAAGTAQARVLVILEAALPDKMRMCTTAREVNPRLVIIAVADSPAEHAWLQEFGAAQVLDTAEALSDALLRTVRTAI